MSKHGHEREQLFGALVRRTLLACPPGRNSVNEGQVSRWSTRVARAQAIGGGATEVMPEGVAKRI